MQDPHVAVHPIEVALWLTCDHLLMHHTNPWELDEALVAWGFDTGPCEVQDHLGLAHVLECFNGRGSPILPRMVAEGRLGKISGVGYYRYPGGGGAVIDPLVEDLILEEAWFGKFDRTPPSDAALVEHVTQALSQYLSEHSTDRAQISACLRLPKAKLQTL